MNMKRRNADCSKLRRPLKRNKITEGIYGSTFLYVKFLMVWMLVLMADFVLDFRFEYLWPFWLLLRSVYDSYKYQGLAFSVFFVCIAVTSDVICYLVIPVQWLFFAASTYVWVQYVWHTERGICLPTVSLWLLCVYIEASVRLRNVKPLPYHMDLCRPFAAHCIGYPVVTLGFGFKSYVSYRLRMRKQKEVERENNFYIQLLQQALPIEQQQTEKQKALPSKSSEEVISNGAASSLSSTTDNNHSSSSPVNNSSQSVNNKKTNTQQTTDNSSSSSTSNTSSNSNSSSSKKQKANNNYNDDIAYIETSIPPNLSGKKSQSHHSVNDYDEEAMANEHNAKSYNKSNNSVASKSAPVSSTNTTTKVNNAKSDNKGDGKEKKAAKTTNQTYANNRDETISRLEGDVKRLKADLQSSRNCEQELRSQINNYVISDKSMKSELYQLRQDNESLQSKLHNLVQSRQQDKQSVSILERKLTELRKEKLQLETQLATERRAKKAEEAATARAVAMASAARSNGECSDSCKLRHRELEKEHKQACRELKQREEQCRQMERETQALRQLKESQNDTEVLMSALAAMQDKNTHLENSLSSETRVKLDLFSALGEAKRQIEIQATMLGQRDLEIAELKSKIAEVLALGPANFAAVACPPSPPAVLGSPHFSDSFTPPPVSSANMGMDGEDSLAASSSLNPNASDYTPKLP